MSSMPRFTLLALSSTALVAATCGAAVADGQLRATTARVEQQQLNIAAVRERLIDDARELQKRVDEAAAVTSRLEQIDKQLQSTEGFVR